MLRLAPCLLFLGLLWVPLAAVALAPPDVISARNLEARFIVVGEVMTANTGALPAHFVLRVTHIVKGAGEIQQGESIKVLMGAQPVEPSAIGAHVQGTLPVQVKTGSLVIVYADRSGAHEGYFSPLLQGLSVVALGRPSD
jgi:hypothetical protein